MATLNISYDGTNLLFCDGKSATNGNGYNGPTLITIEDNATENFYVELGHIKGVLVTTLEGYNSVETIVDCDCPKYCDPDLHESFGIIGPPTMCPGDVLTYTIKNEIIDECRDEFGYGNIWIYLSYLGSTLVPDVDFSGPTKLFLEEGVKSLDFEVMVYAKDVEDKNIVIDITAEKI